MAAPTTAPTRVSIWEIDPSHSAAHSSVRHMMVSTVRGEFGKIAGTVKLDPADLTRSSIQLTIDTASINTREPQRDAHLRSADFFDVERFPTIEFKSTRITKTGPETYEVAGRLTMHGVTRNIVGEEVKVSIDAELVQSA